MKLGFKKIIFCRKIPKSPFLSNLYNKRIQSKLKVEETKLNFLIDQVKNKHSFARNYSMFSKSMTKLPLIMKNNNHTSNKDYSYNSYLYYNKKLSPEFQTINLNILNSMNKLFKVEKQLINQKKRVKNITQ